MSKKEMPRFLKQKVKEIVDKQVSDLTGKKITDFDTEEKRQDLRREIRRQNRWGSFMAVAWLLAAMSFFMYSHFVKLPHPDVIRKDGVLHEGVVTKRHFPKPGYSGSASKHSGGSFVGVTFDDGHKIKEIIRPEILEKMHFQQKINVWEYDGRFWVDEYDNLVYYNPYPFLIAGVVFLLLGIVCFLKKRRRIVR